MAVGYTGSLNPGYPQYLGREDFHTVYLNLIGPPTPLLQLLSFEHFELRANYVLRDLPLLIHCNRGESRGAIPGGPVPLDTGVSCRWAPVLPSIYLRMNVQPRQMRFEFRNFILGDAGMIQPQLPQAGKPGQGREVGFR